MNLKSHALNQQKKQNMSFKEFSNLGHIIPKVSANPKDYAYDGGQSNQVKKSLIDNDIVAASYGGNRDPLYYTLLAKQSRYELITVDEENYNESELRVQKEPNEVIELEDDLAPVDE
jgi:hypothetical protein